MSSYWQILGLDAASAKEKDAKIAYARLIKLHRPDTDPLGFQRVREAYEVAVAILKQQAAAATTVQSVAPKSEQTAPSLPAETVSAPGLPSSLAEAEAAVARAREAGDQSQLCRAIGCLFAVCGSLASGSGGIRLWQESLHRVTDGRADLVVLGVSVPQLMAELESGTSVITHACIGCWESAHELPSLMQLSEAMIGEPARANNGDAAIVALRLALEIAFATPSIAQALSNLAFPHLDREARERYMPEVDRQAHVGSIFAGFRHDQFDYWHQRFRRPATAWQWHDPAAEAAIEYLVTARSKTWEGIAFIQQIAPDEWFQRLMKSYTREPAQPAARAMPEMVELAAQQRRSPVHVQQRSRGWRLVAALVLIGGVIALLASQGMPLRQRWQKGADPEPASWSLLSLESPAHQRLTMSDDRYAEGRAECDVHVAEVRSKYPSAASWVTLLRSMHDQAAVTFTPHGKLQPDRVEAFRSQVQTFFKGIARSESDPMVEQHALELIVLDPTLSELLKKEAIYRQQETLVPSAFLPCWQLAARSCAEDARRIGVAATWFLAHKGQSVSLDARDRDVLTFLAHELPADAMADTTDATAQR